MKMSAIAALGLTVMAWASTPAHAEFFNDVKRTFQTDVPHFFQDDIPCAFGGQPTSHAKRACKPNGKTTSGRSGDPAKTPLRGEAVADPQPVFAPKPVPYK